MNVKLFVVSILLCVPMNFFAARKPVLTEPVLTAEEIGLLTKVGNLKSTYPPPHASQQPSSLIIPKVMHVYQLNKWFKPGTDKENV